jgi:hypothetical protein
MAFICPQSTVDKLEKEKMPRKGGRWWFSWRRRDFPAEEVGGHGHRVGLGQGRRWGSLIDVLPTAQCPKGENHIQRAAGVSAPVGSAAGAWEGLLWAGAEPVPLPQLWLFVFPQALLSSEVCLLHRREN